MFAKHLHYIVCNQQRTEIQCFNFILLEERKWYFVLYFNPRGKKEKGRLKLSMTDGQRAGAGVKQKTE